MQEKPVQHYRVTLEQAKRDYRDGLLTATGLVYYAIAIMRPIGQKLRVKKELIEELNLNRRTFTRVLSKLRLQDRLDWEPTEDLTVWLTLPKDIESLADFKSQKTKIDAESLSLQATGQIDPPGGQIDPLGGQIDPPGGQIDPPGGQIDPPGGQIDPYCGSKPALYKGYRTSPDITDIYQIFLISLSNSERENFEIFLRKSVDMLPSKPVLPDKWIATHHQELYRRYKASTKHETKSEAIALPSDEQMAELQELKKVGEIKNFYLNSQTGNGTIVVDTGCGLLFWWEFFESMGETG